MVQNFGGILNLIVFIALTIGWAMYGFQMSAGIKKFYDKFGISHTGIIIGGFVGSFAMAAVVMHIMILFRGAEGAWYLFVYSLLSIISLHEHHIPVPSILLPILALFLQLHRETLAPQNQLKQSLIFLR